MSGVYVFYPTPPQRVRYDSCILNLIDIIRNIYLTRLSQDLLDILKCSEITTINMAFDFWKTGKSHKDWDQKNKVKGYVLIGIL